MLNVVGNVVFFFKGSVYKTSDYYYEPIGSGQAYTVGGPHHW